MYYFFAGVGHNLCMSGTLWQEKNWQRNKIKLLYFILFSTDSRRRFWVFLSIYQSLQVSKSCLELIISVSVVFEMSQHKYLKGNWIQFYFNITLSQQ